MRRALDTTNGAHVNEVALIEAVLAERSDATDLIGRRDALTGDNAYRPFIRHVLDISTCHVPTGFSKNLHDQPHVIAYQHTYGWFMNVPSDDCFVDDTSDWPVALLRIAIYARALDCDWVLFDADGQTDPNLPTYEW